MHSESAQIKRPHRITVENNPRDVEPPSSIPSWTLDRVTFIVDVYDSPDTGNKRLDRDKQARKFYVATGTCDDRRPLLSTPNLDDHCMTPEVGRCFDTDSDWGSLLFTSSLGSQSCFDMLSVHLESFDESLSEAGAPYPADDEIETVILRLVNTALLLCICGAPLDVRPFLVFDDNRKTTLDRVVPSVWSAGYCSVSKLGAKFWKNFTNCGSKSLAERVCFLPKIQDSFYRLLLRGLCAPFQSSLGTFNKDVILERIGYSVWHAMATQCRDGLIADNSVTCRPSSTLSARSRPPLSLLPNTTLSQASSNGSSTRGEYLT